MIDEDEPQSPPDAADLKTAEKLKRRLRKEAREAQAFWRGVLADQIGRREVWRLLRDAHVFETRFACGPNGFPQPEATWFHAGEQDFGQRLYRALLRMDLAGVTAMHREHDQDFVENKG